MGNVILTEYAQEDLNKLNKTTLSRVIKALERLDSNINLGKRLTGRLNMVYSYRFGTSQGEYRTAYLIENGKAVVIAIGPRENFYRLLERRM